MAIRKQKIKFFEDTIVDFLQKSGRSELPWRKKGISPYEVWVSEIMLQQTQVSRVVDYYTKFLKKFPTIQVLARASWEQFLPYYQGLGYYARGRNMLHTAQKVVTEHGGIFPKTKEALVALPGIGDYTASAILSFAYNKNVLAWDTNLRRVVGRFFYGSKDAPREAGKLETEFTLSRKKLNAGLMDFGSRICMARPKCANCPLQKQCVYFCTQGKGERRIQKTKQAFPLGEAQVFLFLHENHRHYYSANKRTFVPFVLPPAYNSRQGIKDFFREKYHLELSVRPPSRKLFVKQIPTLFVNAQILAGTPVFATFPKQSVTGYNTSVI